MWGRVSGLQREGSSAQYTESHFVSLTVLCTMPPNRREDVAHDSAIVALVVNFALVTML